MHLGGTILRNLTTRELRDPTMMIKSTSSFVLPLLRLYVLLLPLLQGVVVVVVVAQEEQQQCGNNATTCLDCLTTDGCTAWSVGMCLDSCTNALQDASCYGFEFFLNQTAEEICTTHDNDVANQVLCAAASTDCGSCVQTLLVDGASVCQWFESSEAGQVGFCDSQCTMNGCGVTSCSALNSTSNNICGGATTCEDCFTQEGCDAWSNGVCFVNCTVAPPDATTCYTATTTDDEGNNQTVSSSIDDVCAADSLNELFCSEITDCGSCVFSELLDAGFCQWLERDAIDGGGGFCASKCRYDLGIGCGVTSCSDLSLNCSAVTTCSDCLNRTDCDAWSVGECFSTCSNAPQDTSCYSSTAFPNQTTAEICVVADASAALCNPIMDCGACVGTALADGSGSFCQWFDEEGYCDVGCGATGCGVTTCTDLSMVACVNITGCGLCLRQEGCGAWTSEGNCFSDCSSSSSSSAGSDNTCYSIQAFPNRTSREICWTARDVKSCEALSDCASCTGTVLADGESVCHWFEEQGVCANDCGANGCGVTTCPVDCSTLSGCLNCLRPGGCNFAAGQCIADCSDAPADTACYGSEAFPNKSPNDICTVFKADRSNAELCTGIPSCGACVATALVNGGTCQWFDEEEQYCSHECNGLSGECGVTTCVDCQAENSCVDCLSLAGCDGWAIGACFKNCQVLPDDTVCYGTASDPDKTPQAICDGAANDTANDKICAVNLDCGSCVGSFLLGNVSTCQWYASSRFCGSRDLFDGNGTTTCSGGGSIHGGVSSLFLVSGVATLAYFWITLVVDSLL